jgi:hypothetical protein
MAPRSSERTIARILVVVAAIAIVSTAAVARGHSVNGFYKDNRYPSGQMRSVQWAFERGFPGKTGESNSYKAALRRAQSAWNSQGQSLTFADMGNREIDFGPKYEKIGEGGDAFKDYCRLERNNRPVSLVFWEPIPNHRPDANTLAEASRCEYSDGTHKFFVAFDRGEGSRWYRGESRKVPRGGDANGDGRIAGPEIDSAGSKVDLQSVAVHEFGHATGQGAHWDPNKDPFNGRGGAICTRYDSRRESMCSMLVAGTAWQRTLGPHDRETFKKAY